MSLKFFRSRRPRSTQKRLPSVELIEQSGCLALALSSNTLQSAMYLQEPERLVLEYTRAMMAALLWLEPRHVLHLGLGGGSMLRFLLHFFPEIEHTVVELNAEVIETAHEHFFIPKNHEKVLIKQGDGIEFVAQNELEFDLILVDAFDGYQMVADMAREPFLHDCRQSLSPYGILSLNFWSSDPHFQQRFRAVSRVFRGQVLQLPAKPKGNIAVFGFRKTPAEAFEISRLRNRAQWLALECGVEFPEFVQRFREYNLHSPTHLEFSAP